MIFGDIIRNFLKTPKFSFYDPLNYLIFYVSTTNFVYDNKI